MPETSPAHRTTSLPVEARARAFADALTTEEKIANMGHAAAGVPRLGFPAYSWWNECLHGVARNGRATVFPQPIGLAAAFDPDLLRRIGEAIAREARAKFRFASAQGNHARYTGLTFWTPTVNIFRDPRWGRGMETYGEDPFLSGLLGRHLVRGLQGPDRDRLDVAACAKHFAVHSGPEPERHVFDPKVSPQDLHDTYLPAFRDLVEEGVEIVMGAYNLLDGVPCCANPALLTGILREQWGFDGHVTSDCWAIDNFHRNSRYTTCEVDSVAAALLAGCDLCCGEVYTRLADALNKGKITEADIDRSFLRLARTWARLGLLDGPQPAPTDADRAVINCAEHRELAADAAARSTVLLRNNGVLPLRDDLKVIYVVGPHAANVDVLLGNYFGASGRLTTLLEGIVARVAPSCAVEYKAGCQTAHPNLNPIDWVSYEAAKADVCIAVMGVSPMQEGEEGEAILSPDVGDRLDTDLPAHQVRFLRKIRKAGAKLVVVLTGGGPITCPEVLGLADALLWIGYPGEAGGEGVARVLFGDEAPAGRLPVTWPRDIRDLPPFESYAMDGRTYRYMETAPLFPFGFGLSYSTFQYNAVVLSSASLRPGGELVATVRVTNTGPRDADEVVQLYLRWKGVGHRTPLQALRGVRRVRIPAGATHEVEFRLAGRALEVVDADGRSHLPPCTLEVVAAGSCPVPRSVELGAASPAVATCVVTA